MDLLRPCEREIVNLLCEGYTPVQVSVLLGKSYQSIKNHLQTVYRLLGFPQERDKAIMLVSNFLLPEGHPLRWDR